MPSSTPTAASDNPTRCSAPAFIRDAGTRHSRPSRSTSPHVAPRASPDRTAVSAVKRIAALTARPDPDASTAASAAGRSVYGNARRCARVFGGLRQCRVDHFARRVHVDVPESLRRREHAPDPAAQELPGRRLVAVDRPEHREHARPVDLVDGSPHQTRRVPRQRPSPRLSGPAAPLPPPRRPWRTSPRTSARSTHARTGRRPASPSGGCRVPAPAPRTGVTASGVSTSDAR